MYRFTDDVTALDLKLNEIRAKIMQSSCVKTLKKVGIKGNFAEINLLFFYDLDTLQP